MATTGSAVEGDDAAWPLLPLERGWHRRRLFVVLLVAASATWCYVIGEYVGYYLPLWPGFLAMTAAAMVGMLLVTLAVVPSSSRFGIDSIQAAVPQFGRNGWLLTVPLQYLSIIGWNSLLLIFFGRSLAQFLVEAGLDGSMSARWTVPLATVAVCAVVFQVLLKGAAGLERVSTLLFFVVVGVGVWLIVTLLVQKGGQLSVAEPVLASSKRLDYQHGIEIGLVSLLAWWPYTGSMTRQAPDARTAVLPAMLGMGLPVPVLSLVGLAGILALKTSDPAEWMTRVGGPLFGVLALLFVLAANLGATTAGIYASTVGLKGVPALRGLPWNLALLTSLVPVCVVGVLFSGWFFGHFGSFLAYLGVFFAPLVGIQIVDYFALRRQRISVRGIYADGPDDPYSLPAAVAAALVHVAVTVLVVRPAGRGGYRAAAVLESGPPRPGHAGVRRGDPARARLR